MKRIWKLGSIPLILVLLLAGLGPSLALDRQTRLNVMAAVVQIGWVSEENGKLYNIGVGSGTIISPDGLILTNCHVADPVLYGMSPDELPPIDYLSVALTVRSDQPPQVAYLAEVLAADPYLDLAVLRINRKLDGRPVNAEDLNLPYVPLGDSDSVEVGDEVNIFGYPGIGGETVTFTKGVVAGFSLDAAVEGRAWIKTDATIAGGNSGGTAVDEKGYLIGVPTRAGAGGGQEYVDCRRLADTNGDGRIDSRDTCIPVGGFINALRPLKLATPLIEAARLGVSYQGRTGGAGEGPAPTGQPVLSNLLFAPDVNEFGQPTTIVSRLPSGARSLYLFFDYQNLSADAIFEMKTTIDGQDAPAWGLSAGPWGGGESGTWWIGWDDAPFVDGTYRFALYLDGKKQAEAAISVGGPADRGPRFANVVFSLEKTAGGAPVEPTTLIPAGTKQMYAFFDYDNLSNGDRWTRTWLVDGEPALTSTETWEEGRSGRYWMELTSQSGLQAGAYRLELYLGDELAARGDFWVTGGRGSSARFDPIVFAEGVDRQGQPQGAGRYFHSGLAELYAFSDYSGMEDDLDVVINWYINGEKVVEAPLRWSGGESGTWYDYVYSNSGALPDGEYGVEIVVEGQTLQSGSATVGSGQPPAKGTPTGPRDGVQLQGTITDMDTGRPIAGAAFLVLKPGIRVRDFQWTEAELYTAAQSDRNGFYRLPDLLERGECYSMIIGAEGYWSYTEDDVCVGQDVDPVVDLPIRLEKK